MLNYLFIIVPVLFVLVALTFTVMLFFSLGKKYQKRIKAIQISKLKPTKYNYTHKNQPQFVLERTRGSVRQAMGKVKSLGDYYSIEREITYP